MNPEPAEHRPAAEIHEIVLELVDHIDAMVAYRDVDQVCVFPTMSTATGSAGPGGRWSASRRRDGSGPSTPRTCRTSGLPNRVLPRDRTAQALALSKRTHRMVALLSVDMDDFERINDVHGHAAGDRFLVVMAARLTRSPREADSVTRMGGDEFLVLCPAVESRAEVEAMAGRILDRVRAPLQLEGTILSPSCSVGIALSAPDGLTPEGLIASSDRALYLAKEHGKNRYAFADHRGTP